MTSMGAPEKDVKDAVPMNEKLGVGDIEAVTPDGEVKLHPQPTKDLLDPLNWTSYEKHSILAICMGLFVSPDIFPARRLSKGHPLTSR
jgi:hypothetical protein